MDARHEALQLEVDEMADALKRSLPLSAYLGIDSHFFTLMARSALAFRSGVAAVQSFQERAVVDAAIAQRAAAVASFHATQKRHWGRAKLMLEREYESKVEATNNAVAALLNHRAADPSVAGPLSGSSCPTWERPFRYDSQGAIIFDATGQQVIDLRGWGRLTGRGSGGLGLSYEEAVKRIDEFGVWLVARMNR